MYLGDFNKKILCNKCKALYDCYINSGLGSISILEFKEKANEQIWYLKISRFQQYTCDIQDENKIDSRPGYESVCSRCKDIIDSVHKKYTDEERATSLWRGGVLNTMEGLSKKLEIK